MSGNKASVIQPVWIWLGAAATVFIPAPYWLPGFESWIGRRLFLYKEPLALLGYSIAFVLLCAFALPSCATRMIDRLIQWSLKPRKIFLLLFFSALLGGIYWINRTVLHSFMNSADEHSCLFLAHCINLGKWWVKSHPLSEFFNVVHVGNRDGKWFSVYPPGWPLLMAFGLRTGILNWLNPAIATTALFFVFRLGIKVFDRPSAFFAVAFAASSPFFTFTSASYFSHATCLLTMAIFIYAFLKWLEQSKESGRILWASIAAAAVGYGLITRYLTMAAFAAPFLIYGIMPVIKRRRKLRSSDLIAIAIMLAFAAVVFYQNYAVTGKFHKAPNQYDKSWEKLGFRGDYTVIDASLFIIDRAAYLMDWSAPLLLAGYVFLILKRPEKDPLKRLLSLSFLFPVAAYFFYYSWGGNQYGPRYYYEGFPFMLLAAGHGLVRAWENASMVLRKCLTGAIAVSLGLSAYLYYKQADFFQEASVQRKALYELAEDSVKKPAVVFIHGFLGDRLIMAQEDAIRNSPQLDSPILYAHDLGERNLKLIQHFPDRNFYLGSYDRKNQTPIIKRWINENR